MRIVIVSTNAGQSLGGEAIKAYQFFKHLLGLGRDVFLVTHGRCQGQLEDLPAERMILIPDDAPQRFFWRSRIFRNLLGPYFHWKTRAHLKELAADGTPTVVHYLCPISPIALRFPPKEIPAVLGPINGNIGYPPAFRDREGLGSKLSTRLQVPLQRILRVIFGEKARFHRILVSGAERTHRSLLAAGARSEQLQDVMDSGIEEHVLARGRQAQTGLNKRFVCTGRFIDYKGIDLAIRAIAETEDLTLDIYGGGACEDAWRALTRTLNVEDRIAFKGWCDNAKLLEEMRRYRGYVFPTLAEANGIVMQEAMALGLPVIALNWGGPTGLADANSALFIKPSGQDEVVYGLARSMKQLAEDPDLAERISVAAHEIAKERFSWPAVAASWMATYPGSDHPS